MALCPGLLSVKEVLIEFLGSFLMVVLDMKQMSNSYSQYKNYLGSCR